MYIIRIFLLSLGLKIKNQVILFLLTNCLHDFFLSYLFLYVCLFIYFFQNQPHYLLELLEVVFDLFRGVAHAHETVLSAIHRVIVRKRFLLFICFVIHSQTIKYQVFSNLYCERSCFDSTHFEFNFLSLQYVMQVLYTVAQQTGPEQAKF